MVTKLICSELGRLDRDLSSAVVRGQAFLWWALDCPPSETWAVGHLSTKLTGVDAARCDLVAHIS